MSWLRYFIITRVKLIALQHLNGFQSEIKALCIARTIIAVSIYFLVSEKYCYALTESKTYMNCSSKTLNGKQIGQLIYIIASHGNLVDVSFIEKTLSTKLRYNSPVIKSEHLNQTRYSYKADNLSGTNISISLDIAYFKEEAYNNKPTAILRIYFSENSCIKLYPEDIYDNFTDGRKSFVEMPMSDSPENRDGRQIIPFSGSDGAKLFISYSYNTNKKNKIIVASIREEIY